MTQNKLRHNNDEHFGVFDGNGTGTGQERVITDPTLPVSLHGRLVPFDAEQMYVPNHQDANGVVHFFAPADVPHSSDEHSVSHELRYYRVAETDDGRIVHDAHSVMPLARRGDYSFPRQTLDMMLMEDDLENAQELASITAQMHGLPFPDPDTITPLRTGVDYRFETGLDDGAPTIQAVKSWREGALDREQRLTIAQYGIAAELDADMRELDEMQARWGVQSAMNLAESMAVASGYLHDGREDARMFTEGPPDPFTTNLQRERVGGAVQRDYSDEDTQPLPAVTPMDSFYYEWLEEQEQERLGNTVLEGSAWFEATFANHAEVQLIQPTHDVVNYAVVVTDTDPWTTELMVEKYWRAENSYLGSDSLTIDTYQSDDEDERAQAQADRTALLDVYAERGLEAMMHRVELEAMENGHLNSDRADTRLFQNGPPDPFETLAHRLKDEPNPFMGIGDDRVDNDETQELPAITPQSVYLLDKDSTQPEPGSWDELIAQQRGYEEPVRQDHYWQMHYRTVERPDGERLGTALFVTEFPQLPTNFDQYVEEFGLSDAEYPTQARTVEMAHFATEADARQFEKEFRSYLLPNVLDGPELAPEVAKLEGLSGEWKDMNYEQIVDYMSGHNTIVREESAWHLHNPNAERQEHGQLEGTHSVRNDVFTQVEADEHTSAPDFDI